ncbi:MAG: double-strand break repair protein AddB [Paracoccus sp. (in: a-proteobacteria)]|uniref:double-strand break repair protein AddB n=1 Tax=Paracoccus sp. TaxID=267 RepID=UPI0026E07B50|nr:double-strand break repair protein AddB [Paracoccus sp. (in: a-proteobacteria)]MDO5621631.1 double-strand break repair protein AddB [Paracoccus sp. (in: a-proteobacteria)]
MKGVYALPPGVDFASELVAGLLDRMQGQPPEVLARVTIWANAGTTLSALKQAFDRRGPLLLPRLRLISDLGAGEAVPLASALARRLQLGRLVEGLIARQPDLRAGQSVPDMAGSLADLMTEMQFEGLSADALDRIDAGQHAGHWQRMLAFLRIAADFYLGGDPVDRGVRLYQAAARLAGDWAEGRNLPADPVLVVGSTGSYGASRLFMRAVAGLPNGAVVLPGYDFDMPETVWGSFGNQPDDHPQARFLPFRVDAAPRFWTWAAAACPARNRLISLALRPAPVTDQWIADGPALGDLLPATQGLTLLEADQPGQEAEAIALMIRKAVGEGRAVALISPDEELKRRVTAALDRWHLVPDDGRGQPLDLTAPGLFLRHIAALFGQALTIDALLVLLKHPLCATGGGGAARGNHLRQLRELELHLRAHGPAFPDADALLDWASRGDQARQDWSRWLAAQLDLLAELGAETGPSPLPARLARLLTVAEGLAAGEISTGDSQLWQGRAGQAVRAVVDHLTAHAHHAHDMPPGDVVALLDWLLAGNVVRQDVQAHPLIRFHGVREARTEVVASDNRLVILAGLNEGSWPALPAPDPWLSRQMRAMAGLTLPEREIGLSAHDFQQGIAAAEVVLTRARRDAEAETIPSRWLNRLLNLLAGLPEQGGQAALQAMRARGAEWLRLAVAANLPQDSVAPAPRPAPIPPTPAIRQLSVTQIRNLIRDPYAIYARYVLGLRPLDPLRPEPGAAMRGQVLHLIVQRLLTPPPAAETPPDVLRARLLAITDAVLAENVPWPSARLFWRARIEAIADRLVADELDRAARGTPRVVEEQRGIDIGAFRLVAKPDRIDALADGTAHLYDYKSGAVPTAAQIKAFDKQLPLEAAMVMRGAFPELGPVDVSGLSYIQLGGEGATVDRSMSGDEIAETWDRFVELIGMYLSGQRGFTARLAMENLKDASDYDHLSRFGEWSLADEAQPEILGGGDDG